MNFPNIEFLGNTHISVTIKTCHIELRERVEHLFLRYLIANIIICHITGSGIYRANKFASYLSALLCIGACNRDDIHVFSASDRLTFSNAFLDRLRDTLCNKYLILLVLYSSTSSNHPFGSLLFKLY